MGKSGGGKSSGSQTQTVTSVPYLGSQVNEAAQWARNLYTGTPSYLTTPSQPTTQATVGGMYVGPDGRVYDTSDKGFAAKFVDANMPRNGSADGGMMGFQTAYARDPQAALRNAGFKPLASSATTAQAPAPGTGQTTPSGWPDFFPGQTYVDYSPETQQALQMMTDRATAGSALSRGANQTVLDTVQGNYLSSNPYIDAVINKSLEDVNRKYAEQVLPGLASNFATSGRYGSGIQQNLTTDAIGQLGKEAMGVASGIRYDNYNNERQRQLQAAALAPTLAASDYYDAQQLLGVGSAREALSQAKLQDAMDRFYFYENQPANMLDQYIARLGALNSGGGTTTTTGGTANLPKASPFAGALSGASAGLGIGSMMAAPGATGLAAFGGPWGVGLGVAGGLLGGLFS